MVKADITNCSPNDLARLRAKLRKPLAEAVKTECDVLISMVGENATPEVLTVNWQAAKHLLSLITNPRYELQSLLEDGELMSKRPTPNGQQHWPLYTKLVAMLAAKEVNVLRSTLEERRSAWLKMQATPCALFLLALDKTQLV